MAYKALYRTYRPTNFEEVAGQKHIVKTLQNAVLTNKIAHAYLFCGPRGTGKTSIAKIFAKVINCESNDKMPCCECDNCLAFQSGNHPDVIEIDAASNNGVDEVRELIEKVKYAPLKGKYKIYIIDEVHMMSPGAFNALLKTIEEPPAHVIFIFATTEPQKVLPTILSRCQRYDFTKVPLQEMIKRVEVGLKNEHIKYEDEAIKLVCQLADGGMRDAWSILDQVIAYASDEIRVEDVNEIYGIITTEKKIELLKLVGEKDVTGCIKQIEQFNEKGIDIKRTTMDLIEILKETVIHDYTNDVSLLTVCDNEQIISAKIGKSTSVRLKMIEELMNVYEKYRFSSNISSYFEVCLLNMMSLESTKLVQNVSRETNTKDEFAQEPDKSVRKNETETVKPSESKTFVEYKETISEVKSLDREYLLQLLVGANKESKNVDNTKLRQINSYLLHPIWAKSAHLLRSYKLLASSTKYIVITVDNEAIANEINEQDSNNAFKEFMEVILGEQKKVFAIAHDQQDDLVREFVARQKSNTLPPAAQIQTKSCVERVCDIFGEGNFEIRED